MTITEKIIQDISATIQSEQPLPFALTHQSIADYYQVSLTPARNAVIALVNTGVIVRHSNGRLLTKAVTAKKQHSHQKNMTIIKPKLKKEWHDAIVGEVIVRSLHQNTEYLREEATAKAFNISRTVVRQIFSHLAGAGLLQHIPRCGWRVHPFDENEMMNYLRVRELLELEALTLARPRLKIEELQTLLDMNKPAKTPRNQSRLHNGLHAYWIDRCGNRYIQEFFSRYGEYYSTLFDYASLDKHVMKLMAQEHRDILECLIRKDWRGAHRALRGHIRDQRENVLRFIDFSRL